MIIDIFRYMLIALLFLIGFPTTIFSVMCFFRCFDILTNEIQINRKKEFFEGIFIFFISLFISITCFTFICKLIING